MSLIYTTIVGVLYFQKKKNNTTENRIFKKIITITLISLIIELLITLVVKLQLTNFVAIMLKIFNVFTVSWIFLFGAYSFVISFKEKNNDYKVKYKYLSAIYKILYSVIVISTLILPVNFSTVKNTFSYYGPSVNVVFGISGFLMFIMLIFSLIKFKNIKEKGYTQIILFILLIGALTIIQYIYPDVILSNILFALIITILYHTIENPDLKMIHGYELAKDTAVKANLAKSDFLSSVSHEIRTPLNAIIGLSEINRDTNSLEESKANSKDILNAANVLHDIIGNVFDLTKIESEDVEIINKEYNPYEMIESIVKVVEHRFKEKSLELNLRLAPDLPNKLLGDKSNLQKAIINLLTNAVKYTNEGYVNLILNCVNENNIARLTISVEDTGIGIKPEEIEKIFHKVSNLDENKNNPLRKTGIGLTITKRIVELMGGNITLQSIHGNGSTFTITIDQKIIPNKITTLDINEEKQMDFDKDKLDFTGKKILLIDDNSLNLKVALRLLKKYNCEVDMVLSAEECFQKINIGFKFDLLLMDEMMPNMSGTECMQKLRDGGYRVPIVVLTADVEKEAINKYLKAGFDEHLGKPLNVQEVERVLKKFLNT